MYLITAMMSYSLLRVYSTLLYVVHSCNSSFIPCSFNLNVVFINLLSGEPDYFGRKKISSGGDLSHYSSASLY